MKTITLGTLVQIINGRLMTGNPKILIRHLNYGKPKVLKPDHVYFYKKSLKWEKQITAIRNARPKAIIIPPHLLSHAFPKSSAIILVPDPYQAFFRAALWNWRQLKPRVIAVTGSAGKSTTLSMIASILKRRWSMVTTQGNLNTFTFLPTYLARLQPHHQLLLLEMGMKSLNNIRRQCQIVRPDIGVVTNVGEAHVGSLGNLDVVVKAKQELVDGIRQGGTIFINRDDRRSQKLDTRHHRGKVRTFGIRNPSHIQGTNIRFTQKGMAFDAVIGGKRYPFFIPTFGVHNVYNALAAIGVAYEFGAPIIDIQKGLSSFQLPKMRLQLIRGYGGRLLINDAWNANPTAMIAGLGVLKRLSHGRPAIAVLGDMLELGKLTVFSHRRVGKYVARLHLSQLITVGQKGRIIAQAAIQEGMDPRKVFTFSNQREVVRHILQRTPANAVVYFKASRKLHFEKIIKQLKG